MRNDYEFPELIEANFGTFLLGGTLPGPGTGDDDDPETDDF